mgnify:CR=1 FL=1
MLTSIDGIAALCELRVELEEDAADEYPQAVLRELLVLFDVCRAFGLDMHRTKSVSGTIGLRYVQQHLEVKFFPNHSAATVLSHSIRQ